MAAKITRLRTKADRIRQEDGRQLRQLVLEFAAGRHISDRAVGEIVSAIDNETAARNGWTFVMVSPELNAAIVDWLIQHSSRPMVAVRLWASLFPFIRSDTCEIVQTRDELAAKLGTTSNHVSRIMSELESIGAISRQRAGGSVRYFMNPKIGNHMTGAARVKAQARAPSLRFDPPAEKKAGRHLSLVPPAE